MPYDPLLVQPMREELTRAGFEELHTPEQVDAALTKSGVSLLVVNSVCGCAAGSMRPGVVNSLDNEKKPDHLVTVFAGQDTEATQYVRDTYLAGQPPSSPSIALFNNGTLIGMIHRYQIEGRFPEAISQALKGAYDEFCVPTADAV
ncbi:MAG: BrxA/BrxB family bacilliredoxin [Candidatus Kapaibacterium sp.]